MAGLDAVRGKLSHERTLLENREVEAALQFKSINAFKHEPRAELAAAHGSDLGLGQIYVDRVTHPERNTQSVGSGRDG